MNTHDDKCFDQVMQYIFDIWNDALEEEATVKAEKSSILDTVNAAEYAALLPVMDAIDDLTLTFHFDDSDSTSDDDE